jgi:hypothetical protein
VTGFQFVALLLASIGPILALGRVAPVPDTLVPFGAGLATTLVRGLPPARLDPQLALELFLPPLLYAGASRASFHLSRNRGGRRRFGQGGPSAAGTGRGMAIRTPRSKSGAGRPHGPENRWAGRQPARPCLGTNRRGERQWLACWIGSAASAA